MLDKKRLSILYFVLIILSSFCLFTTNSAQIIDPGSIELAPLSFEYTLHSSITISSDADLYLFPGSGTHEEPFFIEGFNITSSDPFGIHISATTKHVLIRNCFIDVSKTGILIEDKLEGTVRIENNIITGSEDLNGHGVVVYLAKEVVLEENIVSNHASSGLVMAGVDVSYIHNNVFSSNGDTGMEVVYVNNLGIYENKCNDNVKKGMYIGGCDNVIIMGNDFSRNRWEGVYLEECEDCFILNNTIKANNQLGMKMDGIRRCLLNYNLFRSNYERGLYLDENCENNWIYLNDFITNSRECYSQGRDEGKGNRWFSDSEKKGNHWSNAIKNEEYKIDGNAKNVDLFPLERPITSSLIIKEDVSEMNYNWIIFVVLLFWNKNCKRIFLTKTNKTD